jgi:hypothetical protein
MIIGPLMDIFERGQQVDYFKGDENIEQTWRELKEK